MQGAHTSGAPAYAAISNLAEMLESCCELMLSKDLIPILVSQIYEGKEAKYTNQLTEHAPRTMGVLVEHHEGCSARCAGSWVYHKSGVNHKGDKGGVCSVR